MFLSIFNQEDNFVCNICSVTFFQETDSGSTHLIASVKLSQKMCEPAVMPVSEAFPFESLKWILMLSSKQSTSKFSSSMPSSQQDMTGFVPKTDSFFIPFWINT